MSTIYTREEKKKIIETMEYMIKEIYEIFDLIPQKEITIRILNGVLHINNQKIYIYSSRRNFRTKNVFKKIGNFFVNLKDSIEWECLDFSPAKTYELYLGEKTLFGPKVTFNNHHIEEYIGFIQHYQKVKAELLKQSEHITEQKKREMAAVEKWNDSFTGETTVELDLPQTQNMHELKITERGKKKIGTLNFGKKTIKIITKGNIVLVNEKEHEKENAKIKKQLIK